MTGASSRRKGAEAERALVAWLREHGHPYAERRGGGFGGSDVVGTPGLTFECKSQAGTSLGAWVDQTQEARAAAGDTYGVLAVKRKGTTDVGRWFGVMPLEQLAALLVEAGYGAAPERERKHQVLLLSGPDSGLLATGSTQLAVWHTECKCGWRGPARLTQAEACDDWLDHVPPAEIDATTPTPPTMEGTP